VGEGGGTDVATTGACSSDSSSTRLARPIPTSYDTITGVLYALPEATLVYPAHDYRGRTVTTIAEEKRWNIRVAGRSREAFIEHMGSLHPRLRRDSMRRSPPVARAATFPSPSRAEEGRRDRP
jgi:hypothetical protein